MEGGRERKSENGEFEIRLSFVCCCSVEKLIFQGQDREKRVTVYLSFCLSVCLFVPVFFILTYLRANTVEVTLAAKSLF